MYFLVKEGVGWGGGGLNKVCFGKWEIGELTAPIGSLCNW